MLFRELNRGKCKTYLIGCEKTRAAALIDPLKDNVTRYLAVLAYYQCRLEMVIDTHTHADHRSGTWEIRDLTDARIVMERHAPAPHVDMHVEDGQTLSVGEVRLKAFHTPGHTPDSISLYAGDRVFTGDTLLIRGTGRADFAGGDPAAQYESIVGKLFTLPDATLVYPAHDYRGNTCSTIGDEKRLNPRLAGRSRDDYVKLMTNLGLPLPDKIQEALQPNETGIDDDSLKFPDLAQLNHVLQLTPGEIRLKLAAGDPPLMLDVRETDEFVGELGHIAGSRLIPLKELPARAEELAEARHHEIIAVCRAGVRSTTAAAILTALGFERVSNLKGGMIAWNEAGLPVERSTHS
jgi:sulfur dioxygenase